MTTNKTNVSTVRLRCCDISTAALHIIAMLFMLMDHLWATLLPAQDWLTCVGRVAFPIFAFMAVEGYFHTHSFKKYAQRLLVFALLSEIPFDLMYGGTWFYPVHQNVIWTFLLGLSGIHLMENRSQKAKALGLCDGFCGGCDIGKCAWNLRHGRLLRCRCTHCIYFLFFQRPEMVVSGRPDTCTLLDKRKNVGRTDVSNPVIRNGYGTLPTGACIAGTNPYLAVPRSAGIS